MRPIQAYVLSLTDASVDKSAIIPSSFMVALSIIATVTGTSTGTLKVQASNDNPGPVDSNGNQAPASWVDIDSETVAIAGVGNYIIPKFDVAYNFLKFVYTADNGEAGTITVKIHGYGFN